MGGAHASSDTFPLPTAPGFPPEAGESVEDEFRRTYFGRCRAGANVLLDASKERRKKCEANGLENMKVTGTNMCKHPMGQTSIQQTLLSEMGFTPTASTI